MLASGVIAGLLTGVAFGGDWRRLSTLSLRLWQVLVVALGLRLIGTFVPSSPLLIYLVSLCGVALVAAWNWRIPGAALIAIGTALNLVVSTVNGGMPYDPIAA